MTAWAVSPHLIDLVLLVTALEAAWLMTGVAQRSQPGRRRKEILLLLLPGVCLMMGIRAALAGVAWPWLPIMLGAAFVAHIADLRRRWNHASGCCRASGKRDMARRG